MIPFPILISSTKGSSILPEGNIKQMSVSYYVGSGTLSAFSSMMILTNDGKLYGQGLNIGGELGLGHKNAILDTFRLTSTGVKRVFAGTEMFLIEKTDGTWLYSGNVGSSSTGQIGHQAQSVTTWSPLPAALLAQFDFTKVVDVASSTGATLYLLSTGEVWGAGGNTSYQLGVSPSSYVNARLVSSTGVQVFSDQNSSAILESNGKLKWAGLSVTWGNNTESQRSYTTLSSPSGFITKITGGAPFSGNGRGMLAEWKDTQGSTERKLSYRYDSTSPAFPAAIMAGQDFSLIPGKYGPEFFIGDRLVVTNSASSINDVPVVPELGPWKKENYTVVFSGSSTREGSSGWNLGQVGLYNGNLMYRGTIRFMNAPVAASYRPLTIVVQD